MTSTPTEPPRTIAEAIEIIESTYEFMLAYAAQGRQREDDDPLGIRSALVRAVSAFDVLGDASPSQMGAPAGPVAEAAAEMLAIMKQDIARARAAFRFVLAQRSIGSQIIDNLNASIHVRALLTDIFLVDEALQGDNPS